ncbi:uncharacterized protein [Diabrotica undecimpunctata]|uniref:uncharacterized protein n=1 Tax=Diabrotica undecimpunctata TaxID=50387 RepID=UPI003B6333F0
MRKTIIDYVAKCLDCQRYKASNLKPVGQFQTPVQSQRFETMSIDLFGPLPETSDGYKWMYVIEDTAIYWPAANPVERKNRDLKPQLAILTGADHTSWKEQIPVVRFAMNSVKSQSTGYSAAFLTFGRELRTPDDLQRDFRTTLQNDNFVPEINPYLKTLSSVLYQARENYEASQDRAKSYAYKYRRVNMTFNVSDKVLVDVHALSKAKDSFTAKFAPRRDGPYIITKVVSPTSYEISSPQNLTEPLGKYHISALVPYRVDTDTDDGSSPNPLVPIRRRGRPPKTALAVPDENHLYEEENDVASPHMCRCRGTHSHNNT